MVRKRLSWMKGGAHVASWLQCGRRVDELIGAAVHQMRNWKEAALPCQQAVKLGHTNMVENEGVDAIKKAGTSWETLHLSCRTKLQKAIAPNIMAIRRDRGSVQTNNKSHCRGQWSWSVGQSCTSLRKKPRCWTNPMKGQYAYEWTYHSHRRTPLAKFTSKINQYFAGKRSRCGRTTRMAVRKLLQTRRHNHIRDWWAGVLANCGDQVETEQFVSEYEPEIRLRADVRAIQDVGGHPTYSDIVASSPWTTGTHEGAESEHKGQPHDDRAVKTAETNKIRDYKPPPSTQAAHIIPVALDIYGRE